MSTITTIANIVSYLDLARTYQKKLGELYSRRQRFRKGIQDGDIQCAEISSNISKILNVVRTSLPADPQGDLIASSMGATSAISSMGATSAISSTDAPSLSDPQSATSMPVDEDYILAERYPDLNAELDKKISEFAYAIKTRSRYIRWLTILQRDILKYEKEIFNISNGLIVPRKRYYSDIAKFEESAGPDTKTPKIKLLQADEALMDELVALVTGVNSGD